VYLQEQALEGYFWPDIGKDAAHKYPDLLFGGGRSKTDLMVKADFDDT